ncbi:hypothetical protein [Actinomadura vinacea]
MKSHLIALLVTAVAGMMALGGGTAQAAPTPVSIADRPHPG